MLLFVRQFEMFAVNVLSLLSGKQLFDLADPWAFYLINAVKAKELFNRDKEYIVADGQINIVDAFTGRVLSGRRFTDGLQQAIEAKVSIYTNHHHYLFIHLFIYLFIYLTKYFI